MKIHSLRNSYMPLNSYKTRRNQSFTSSIDDKIAQKSQAYVLEARAYVLIQSKLSEKALGIKEEDLEGLKPKTKKQRKEILTQWRDFISQETNCGPEVQFAIMKSLASELKKDNDTLPPKLNKPIAQACIKEYKGNFDICTEAKINFREIYTELLNEKNDDKSQRKTCAPLDLIGGV